MNKFASEYKPDKEPYQKAIDILQSNKKDCTIFEDSNSGYKSAKNFGTEKICLILHGNTSDYVRNSDEYKIEDYNDFDVTKMTKDNEKVKLTELIKQKLHYYPIRNINLNDKKADNPMYQFLYCTFFQNLFSKNL